MLSTNRNVVKRNSTVQIESIDNNTETPDHNHPGHGTNVPIDNNFPLASLHFRCCEMRAMPNVEPFGNLF